jgi:large subunit ribosomal protein L3
MRVSHVKRWGIQVRKRKHSRGGKKRHIGNLGPWTPHHVRWQVPQMGQMGYQQRTDFNKRVLKIGEDGAEITPDGGFINSASYGTTSDQGSIPVRQTARRILAGREKEKHAGGCPRSSS